MHSFQCLIGSNLLQTGLPQGAVPALQTGLPQGAVTSCIQAFHRELSQAALFFPQGAVTTCTLFNVDRELSQAALFSMSSSIPNWKSSSAYFMQMIWYYGCLLYADYLQTGATTTTCKSQNAKIAERVSNRLNVLKRLAGSVWASTEVTLKPLEKAHNQALRLITGGIKSSPIDAMHQVTGSTTIGSLIKEKALILLEKLLSISMDKFFSTYENSPRHLKTQSGLMQKAIELKKALQIDDKPKSLSLPMNPLADFDEVDTLAKKGTTIMQCMDRPMSFHTMKALIRREFQTSWATKLKLEQRRNSGQWQSPTYPTGQESKPLLSLDYVPDTIACQNTFTDWDYTLNPHDLYVTYRRKWIRLT
ncbi:unnamed protein product [Rodentolepis nana]|uniref:Uncharacterized protein n=1 Tax=Rodentolepis nana TaxID=102285 RepID=A0A3P7S799_RODNA|nr:unnamed protein product [Rodentolepis nana]